MSRQFLLFVCVGIAGFLVDAGTVFGLTALGVSPLVARLPALVLAIVTTWLLNRRITFDIEKPSTAAEFTRYFGVATVSAILNFAVYSLLVMSGLAPVISVAIATLALMAFSFFGYKIFAFKLRK